MALTTQFPSAADMFACLPQSDWIDALNDVTTAETTAIPDGAKFVLMSATGTFYAKIGGASVTAAVVTTEVADGTGSMCNPTIRKILPGQTHISVAAPSAVDVTFEFFKASSF